MVKIRLKRFGAKKNPHYRIVVTDSRRARDGAYLESLGSYDPRGEQHFTLDNEKLEYWVSKGAQVSPRVKSLVKRHLQHLQGATVKETAPVDKEKKLEKSETKQVTPEPEAVAKADEATN